MNDSQFYSKFSALPDNLKTVAAEFIEFLLQKAEREEIANLSFQSSGLSAGEDIALEEQIAEENKLLDEEFERVIQTEGRPVRPEDLYTEADLKALKNTFPATAQVRNTEL